MPEDWVDPARFYAILERVGAPHDEVIDRSAASWATAPADASAV